MKKFLFANPPADKCLSAAYLVPHACTLSEWLSEWETEPENREVLVLELNFIKLSWRFKKQFPKKIPKHFIYKQQWKMHISEKKKNNEFFLRNCLLDSKKMK